MKKILAVILTAALTLAVLAGCAGEKGGSEQNKKLKIIATIFPEYNWLQHITKGMDNVELTMLMDSGADMHSFQPTADDIYRISSSDLFVYTGGESDKWVADVLKSAPRVTAVNLMETLGDRAKQEEVKEGMEADEDEGEDKEDEGIGYDEHIWLSLKNAGVLCQSLCDKLAEKDSAHKDEYRANTQAYVASLNKLDKKYAETVKSAKYDTLIFADRFPFRYLTDDYNLKYYAAFVGCSAETEASFKTVKFLADKLNALKLPALCTIEGNDKKIAKTVMDTAGAKNTQIITLDSMQSTVLSDNAKQTDYLTIMEKNLDAIRQALN